MPRGPEPWDELRRETHNPDGRRQVFVASIRIILPSRTVGFGVAFLLCGGDVIRVGSNPREGGTW